MAETCALNVLIVHGIGWTRTKRYARPLEDGIRSEFDRAIRRLRLRDVDRDAARAKNALRFEAVCWDPVTQRPQDALLKVVLARSWLLRRISLTFHLRRQMVGLIGDVIAYESGGHNAVYRAIHDEVERGLDTLQRASAGDRLPGGDAPLTIIGHSLGSIIASDYVWDKTHGATHRLSAHGLSLSNMMLMGSPMALYALRGNAGGGPASIRASLDCPVQIDPEGGWWLNLYDRQDALAFPLEPIEAYRRAGVIDCAVNAGTWLTRWNLASHTGYWRCGEVMSIVGRKLALDWARLNSEEFAARRHEKALAALRKEIS